jgi:hypothetical protein
MSHRDNPEKRIADLEHQLDGSRVSAAESVRCLIFNYGGGWTGLRRRVAIDIDRDTVSVSGIDGERSALWASAWRQQVTVTPAAFRARKGDRGRTMPVLIVSVPGLPPLTVGCDVPLGGPVMVLFGGGPRFWWRGRVPWVKTPSYGASVEDWLVLVESFGLTKYLKDRSSRASDDSGQQWVASPQDMAAAAATGRDRRPVRAWILGSLTAQLAVFIVLLSAFSCYLYLSGTPTTATVTKCANRSNCRGTWNIGGVEHSGPIEVEFSTPSVGSHLKVHVIHGTAHTATFWLGGLGAAGVLAAGSALVFVSTRGRTGTLVDKP